ncbi:MAG TPA: hypothetical protein ENI52_05640 [Thermoplasmata archaeon]|nr:hypothetical protein [Thermoplasmata archaeon]
MVKDNIEKNIIASLTSFETELIIEALRELRKSSLISILEKAEKDKIIQYISKFERERTTKLLKSLAIMEGALNKNYQELSDAIESYYRDFKDFEREDLPQLYQLLDEINRLFHNYLASVYSLDNHTRIFYRILFNEQLNEEFKRFKNLNKEHKQFLRELRAFIQHYGLFSPIAWMNRRTIYDERGEGVDQYLLLEKRKLLALDKKFLLGWRGWDNGVKKYIEGYEESIDLEVLINEYQKSTKEIYDRLYKKVIEIYSKKYPEMKKLISEIEKRRIGEILIEKKKNPIIEGEW